MTKRTERRTSFEGLSSANVYPMAWHGMALDLTLTTRGTVFPDWNSFEIFHTRIICEKELIFYCNITMKALSCKSMTITVLWLY